MQETYLTEFEKRGYFSQCTDRSGLSEVMSKGKIKAYIGFDCTAPSLHVGSLMQIMCLRLLQKIRTPTDNLARWRNDINWRSVW